MNAARVCLAAGLVFAGAQATAQPPPPPQPYPPVTVPQPSAPSSLPDGHHRDDPYARYVVEAPHGYEYGDEAPNRCMARRATGEASAGQVGTDANIIDWCAVPAFEPRYAPQIPASWWWRRHPWREWRPW